ncbi:MAG: Stp1/IreP family PP2C-type Ser/Thr phosphatase [Lachnospiraceae bacterium]|nr:Stp1/IreP family PP2C-type Ser/Thr phosphatase [Lachnospiraceae bacterium]
MKAYGKTDIGRQRSINQDCFFLTTKPIGIFPNLFIIADGMGGHKAGDRASRQSVDKFVEYAQNARSATTIQAIEDGILYINHIIREEAASNEDFAGMGTTFIVAFIEGDTLHVANIGDSRLYYAEETMTQVTEDHSYVAAMVRAGEITREQARNHPDRNIITRAIGAIDAVEADFFEIDMKPGGRVVICTDGLSNMVHENVIYQEVMNKPVDEAAESLIRLANENGGTDNSTVIVIDPYGEEEA